MGAAVPLAVALVSSGDVPLRATVDDVTSAVIIDVTEPNCAGFWQRWPFLDWWARAIASGTICDIFVSGPMMRLRKRNSRLSSASDASRDQQFSRLLNLRRSVWLPVALVICLAVVGLASARRRPRGSRAQTDLGSMHLTQVPWRRCISEPADTFDWLRSGHDSSQEDDKSVKHRSFSDTPEAMFYRIDSILAEEDVNSLQLQHLLQRRPLLPHQPQLEHKQQFPRAATV
mmetsp:Transcript_43726/g.86748  ORF Transcript_43726/g.86748 Transcript_43726/m.86748 type:complete len:230 (+) Transcript_43726:76-765(+)